MMGWIRMPHDRMTDVRKARGHSFSQSQDPTPIYRYIQCLYHKIHTCVSQEVVEEGSQPRKNNLFT
jgi:hypothetical protein